MDAVTLQNLQAAQGNSMSCMAALAWVSYDIIIAMDQEIEHIWCSNWSVGKVLYIIARYASFATVLLWWLMSLASSPPDWVCGAWPIVMGIGIVLVGVSVDLIQMLRIRALFNASRKVTIPLYVFFACVVLVAIVQVITTRAQPNDVDMTTGCTIEYHNTDALIAWVAQLVLGSIFFLLTIAKMCPFIRQGGRGPPLLTAFFQGGVVFFAIIFVTELFNAICQQVMPMSSPNQQVISFPWMLSVYGIIAPRLVLHLRGVISQSAYGNNSGLQEDAAAERESWRSWISRVARAR